MRRNISAQLLILMMGFFTALHQGIAQPCNIVQLPDTVRTCAHTTVQLNATIDGTAVSGSRITVYTVGHIWIPSRGVWTLIR
jgi:hypothetical protein